MGIPRLVLLTKHVTTCTSKFIYYTRAVSLFKVKVFFISVDSIVACKQALHLRDIVKSTRARGTREEKPLRGAGGSFVLARLASLAQIGELARRLIQSSQRGLLNKK